MDKPASGTVDSSGRIEPQQLDQLQGLHLPDAVGWWPLAPGWWILAVVLLVMIFLVFVKTLNRWQQPKTDSRWLKQINQCYDDWLNHRHSTQYLQRINSLLRLQAIQLSGRRRVARLTGKDWLDYLTKTTEVAPSEELQHLLSQACYQHNVAVNVDRVHPGVVQLAQGLTYAHANRSHNAMASASR